MILAEIVFQKEGSTSKMSWVKHPAVELNYVKLSQEKPLSLAINEERQEIIGIALIPNKKYYRGAEYFGGNEDGEIFFSKETVKEIGMDYLNNANNSVNIEHSIDVDNTKVRLTQSWFVETEGDKIYDLGFTKEQVPLGTWCLSQNIIDKELWETVKTNTNGFSIEGRYATRILSTELKHSYSEAEVVDAIVEIIKNYNN